MGFDGCQRGDPQFLLSLAADYRELREHLRHPPVQSPGLTQKYLAYAWGKTKMPPGKHTTSNSQELRDISVGRAERVKKISNKNEN